jgi:glycosyltransferase involved in cell wall biosynthesis
MATLAYRESLDRAERLTVPAPAVAAPPVLHAVRQPTITAVIPTRNEAQNLPHVLPQVDRLVDEIVLVDGRSIDDTVAVALRLVPQITIVHQPKTGKGDALRAGFKAASSDIIVMLDADGSTCPSEIPLFVGALLAGADFAKGTRFVHGAGSDDMSTFRRLGNGGLVALTRLLHGGRYSDLCYGYNAFWRSCLAELQLTGDGFEIETIMNIRALRAGLDVREVPSFEQARRHGQSNLRAFADGYRVLKAILAEVTFPRATPRRMRGVPSPQAWPSGTELPVSLSRVSGTAAVESALR